MISFNCYYSTLYSYKLLLVLLLTLCPLRHFCWNNRWNWLKSGRKILIEKRVSKWIPERANECAAPGFEEQLGGFRVGWRAPCRDGHPSRIFFAVLNHRHRRLKSSNSGSVGKAKPWLHSSQHGILNSCGTRSNRQSCTINGTDLSIWIRPCNVRCQCKNRLVIDVEEFKVDVDE